MKKRLKKVVILTLIFIIMLQNFSAFFIKTLADGPGNTVEPGTGIKIPSNIQQTIATEMPYTATGDSSGNWQYEVKNVWRNQNCPTDENNWAYINLNGEQRYLVALATTFGWSGDYVDITLGDGRTIPAVIGDSKSATPDWNAGAATNTPGGAYIDENGVHWGHYYEGNKCDVLEIILKDQTSIPWDLMETLTPVTEIVNGGSIFDENGPVGLKGYYNFGNTSNGNSKQAIADDEDENFAGQVGSFIRKGLISGETSLQNIMNGRNDATVLYTFKKVAGPNYLGAGAGNGDIMATCEIMNEMLSSRGCYYSLGGDLISGNIDKQTSEGKAFCCATYVAAVLYYAGILPAEFINKYNYHYTGSGGLPDMFDAAVEQYGWQKVDPSEAMPGDLVVDIGVHAMIYAGNGEIWDEQAAITCIGGSQPPTKRKRKRSIANCRVWRAPKSVV